jgi:hypothetical protein
VIGWISRFDSYRGAWVGEADTLSSRRGGDLSVIVAASLRAFGASKWPGAPPATLSYKFALEDSS